MLRDVREAGEEEEWKEKTRGRGIRKQESGNVYLSQNT